MSDSITTQIDRILNPEGYYSNGDPIRHAAHGRVILSINNGRAMRQAPTDDETKLARLLALAVHLSEQKLAVIRAATEIAQRMKAQRDVCEAEAHEQAVIDAANAHDDGGVQ